MKKQILDLGKILNKVEQKQINGGLRSCESHNDCPTSTGCCAIHNLCMAPWMYYDICN